MTPSRLLVIGLDGFEISLAEAMMAAGELPHLQALAANGAVFDIDHGRARATGLAWEQVATGRAPDEGGRWSAVRFDPQTYTVCQEPTRSAPIFAALDARMVVFDPPYFDLSRTSARGVTNWGAHDPGVAAHGKPLGLDRELLHRFGPYAAKPWIYGFTWPSQDRTLEAGRALAEAVRQRSRAARWLLHERLPDWDLALVTISESHSAIEQFWHGVDPDHPLHGLPSGAPAGRAMREIYREIDRLCGDLQRMAPDAGMMVFAMHGMGANQADVAAMALLPELMYRLAFGQPHAATPVWPNHLDNGIPLLEPDQSWHQAMNTLVPAQPVSGSFSRLARLRRRIQGRLGRSRSDAHRPDALEWMPAARYQPFWEHMPAFAFPAFYDGQIRLNLAGRERSGRVPIAQFEAVRDGVVDALHRTRCAITGLPVVEEIWFPRSDPLLRSDFEPDLFIQWNETPLGFDHPTAGRIGPYPFRRTGGHTGERGFAYIDWPGIAPRRGRRSAFDIVPTIFHLLGQAYPPGHSGQAITQSRP
ncbi:hypothetical protein THITH_07725 [Thioalkalivibrio paradoxus ARh 1]|uniref:Nucleotide pyrophosphatase n=2 Tax=Thioalkalivibrio paradoxus TaxID=108010 RepID=W0DT45_9GAMM|nr:hypothetical protein THITH_07725 [Thioalkalivibrio paradoxus ARh 1]